MTIIRTPRKQQNFTIMSNTVCQDKNLSMRALGLLTRILSYPDNWATNSESLARDFDCGRDQMRSTLKELVDAGYMSLQKFQNELGHWNSHWSVFEESINVQQDEPMYGQPSPGKPYLGAVGAIQRTNIQRTNTKENVPDRAVKSKKDEQPEEPQGFTDFWKIWPSNDRKQSKSKCREVWKKANAEKDVKVVLAHIEKLKKSREWLKNDGEYIPAPLVYLNQRRWDGAEVQESTTVAVGDFFV